MVKDKLLKRYVIDGDNKSETTVIPRAITAQVLQMVHDHLGHNGSHITYTLLKKLLLERVEAKCRKTHKDVLSVSKGEYTSC